MPTRYSRLSFLALAVLLAGFLVYARQEAQPLPILKQVDLALHEASHLFMRWAPEPVYLIAGSAGQVLILLLLGAASAWKRSWPAAVFCLGWAGVSAIDVSVYIADGPIQALPLVGGNIHDWAWLLSHWGALDRAGQISSVVEGAGLALIAGALSASLFFAWRPPRLPRLASARRERALLEDAADQISRRRSGQSE